jgi:tetratricopeptide (TPR) repeat protein
MTSASRYPAILLASALLIIFAASAGRADPVTGPATSPGSAAKAAALVNAAINMTDSQKAVKLLWQATDIDPTFQEAYVYLGLYYNSRSDFANVIKVYQKMVKYRPNEVSAYLNIGEAYMSFSPPKMNAALSYYQKAYQLDPKSAFAALRIGEILAHQGNRSDAIRYLRQASAAGSRNPTIAAEAQKVLSQMGAS